MESVHLPVDTVYGQVKAHLAALDGPVLVDELRTLLGARLVAYLAGESSTDAVTAYATAAVPVPDHAYPRLQEAYTVAALQQRLGASPQLIQAWFQGRNPRLNDQAPARVIAEDPDSDRWPLVSAAATLVSA